MIASGHPYPPAPKIGDAAAGRGLEPGARVSFAKPTKDGRASPRLDGGWGERPTEEESGSARARKGPAPFRAARPKDFRLPHLSSPVIGTKDTGMTGRGTSCPFVF